MSNLFVPGVAPTRENLPLASIFLKEDQPDQDIYEPPELREGEDYYVLSQHNLGKLLESTKDTTYKTNVTRILSASFEKSATDTKWLGDCEVRRYQLKDPKKLFKKIIKLQETREWLQDEIRDGAGAAYFMVGYLTAVDATGYEGASNSSGISVDAQVPVGDILTHGVGLVLPLSNQLDSGGKVDRESSSKLEHAWRSSGERVYAFSYRKVKWKFWARNKAASSKLKADNIWKFASDMRGEDEDDDDDEEEDIEVSLEEDEANGSG